jgi:hypothetical protein
MKKLLLLAEKSKHHQTSAILATGKRAGNTGKEAKNEYKSHSDRAQSF